MDKNDKEVALITALTIGGGVASTVGTTASTYPEFIKDIVGTFTSDPLAATVASGIFLGGVAASASSSGTSESLQIREERFGPFWKDTLGNWHYNNTVPYSEIDQRATIVYNQLHPKNDKIIHTFPYVIVPSALIEDIPIINIKQILKTLDSLEPFLNKNERDQ